LWLQVFGAGDYLAIVNAQVHSLNHWRVERYNGSAF